MTPLQNALAGYLALRRTLGFKLARSGLWLPNFVEKLEKSGATHIQAKFAVSWAMDFNTPLAKSWTQRLSMVRSFAKYMHARDSQHELVPIELSPPNKPSRIIPYLYTDADVCLLMNKARQIFPKFKGDSLATLIGLLAATGMRVGEAISLERSDINQQKNILLIRNTKFGKTRQIPIDPSVSEALYYYAKKRDQLITPKTNFFFLSMTGTQLFYQNVHTNFRVLIRKTDLNKIKPHHPRIHDLRHSFAIKTLNTWYKTGRDTGPMLPALSTYLGHCSPESTYWYLQATPELLQQACLRLEKANGGQP
jgi:integrase/recombinase XerD